MTDPNFKPNPNEELSEEEMLSESSEDRQATDYKSSGKQIIKKPNNVKITPEQALEDLEQSKL